MHLLLFSENHQAVAYSGQPQDPPPHHHHHSEGGHCQSVLHPQGVFNVPLYFINSVETAAPFKVISHPQCRKFNLWKSFLTGIEPVTLVPGA